MEHAGPRGYRARGRTTNEAAAVMADAVAIAEAGAFSIVVEGVMEQVAQAITAREPENRSTIGFHPQWTAKRQS